MLTPVYNDKNYSEEQTDLLLYENHLCIITNKGFTKEHVCRRCLTAFKSQYIPNQHLEMSMKQDYKCYKNKFQLLLVNIYYHHLDTISLKLWN